jgi:hypothetical protein
MSAPVIVSTVPSNNDTDIVLGSQVNITFDQQINTSTFTDATFSMTYPIQGGVLTTTEEIENNPLISPSNEYVRGTISFTTGSQGQTIATFTPKKPLRPGIVYTIYVVGADGILTASGIQNLAGEAMLTSYQFSFTTGVLNVLTPPPQAPLPYELARIDENKIIVRPKAVVDNDLTKQIELIFPCDVNINSFNPKEIEVGVEAILGDLKVHVPKGLTSAITIKGNTITVVISGWPPEREWPEGW